ncbi:S9 family peptidase [Acetobacter thailandicus]|uniref:S9 family peptidase n=1 Tax=Acetobacter thailandicus TaxID=1502842 RepID=UPI0020125247|nr:prolyl oligopeptidase family serine peptidase [Acetobacter thailandicus]
MSDLPKALLKKAHQKPLPCGTWPSPVTVDLVAGKALALSEVSVDGTSVYWLERRPSEKGRTVLCCWQDEQGISDALGASYDVGTRVHEYGGAPYAVCKGVIAFSEKRTDFLWLQPAGCVGEAICLSRCDGLRYADLRFSSDGAVLFAVREDHRAEGEPKAALVAFSVPDNFTPDSAPPVEVVLREGPDFLSSPSLSPDGRFLVWIEWHHPDMPWDATQLCHARLLRDENGYVTGLGDEKILAGNGAPESLLEPCWTKDGRLYVLSDREGAWTLWEAETRVAQTLLTRCPVPEGEIGQPAWVFGQRSYQLLPDGGVLALVVQNGSSRCVFIAPDGQSRTVSASPEQCPLMLSDGRYAWLEVASDALPAVVVGTIAKGVQHRLRCAASLTLAPEDISVAQTVRFPLEAGGEPVGHAFFYPPASSQASVPEGERPPMIVLVHGGPTARAQEGFSFKIQWWTSRGFAVLDVNYGGSTGFGRSWRERLKGAWGVVDVADCIAACQFMCTTGKIDPDRISIRGSSAGGMTVLVALATSSLFAGGVSLYGVTDLRALAAETHKFEARYLDGLIGPWPEAESAYIERSPLTVAAKICSPVLLLQGAEDKVVPPAQAYAMEAALKEAGTPCFLHEFPGEGHGFRQESTLRIALAEEVAFYGRIFGFTPPSHS